MIGIVSVEDRADSSSTEPSRTVKDTEARPEAVSGAVSTMCEESCSVAESMPPLALTVAESVITGDRELSRTST